MKTEELRDLSVQELTEREFELRKTLFNLRFQMSTGQLSSHTSIRKAKRDIARVKTVLREIESGKGKTGDENVKAE